MRRLLRIGLGLSLAAVLVAVLAAGLLQLAWGRISDEFRVRLEEVLENNGLSVEERTPAVVPGWEGGPVISVPSIRIAFRRAVRDALPSGMLSGAVLTCKSIRLPLFALLDGKPEVRCAVARLVLPARGIDLRLERVVLSGAEPGARPDGEGGRLELAVRGGLRLRSLEGFGRILEASSLVFSAFGPGADGGGREGWRWRLELAGVEGECSDLFRAAGLSYLGKSGLLSVRGSMRGEGVVEGTSAGGRISISGFSWLFSGESRSVRVTGVLLDGWTVQLGGLRMRVAARRHGGVMEGRISCGTARVECRPPSRRAAGRGGWFVEGMEAGIPFELDGSVLKADDMRCSWRIGERGWLASGRLYACAVSLERLLSTCEFSVRVARAGNGLEETLAAAAGSGSFGVFEWVDGMPMVKWADGEAEPLAVALHGGEGGR